METVKKKNGRKAYTLPEGTVINWSQTDKDIAAQLHVSTVTVWKLRRKQNQPANKRGRRKLVA